MSEPISKTQRKKQAQDAQALGIALIKLSNDKRQRLQLPTALDTAISTIHGIKSHGAYRRQVQLIGKLMRQVDIESLRLELSKLVDEEKGKTALFHQIESWREQLIASPEESLTKFCAQYHPDDMVKLRTLIKKARQDLENGKNTGAYKALFQFIKSILS